MVFKLIKAAEKSWHRLRGKNQLPKVISGMQFTDGEENKPKDLDTIQDAA